MQLVQQMWKKCKQLPIICEVSCLIGGLTALSVLRENQTHDAVLRQYCFGIHASTSACFCHVPHLLLYLYSARQACPIRTFNHGSCVQPIARCKCDVLSDLMQMPRTKSSWAVQMETGTHACTHVDRYNNPDEYLKAIKRYLAALEVGPV